MLLLVYVIVLLLIAALLRLYQWRRSLPPGPPTRSLLYGNFVELSSGERYEPQLLAWSKAYGPVFTFFMGPRACVAVTDPKLIVRRRFWRVDASACVRDYLQNQHFSKDALLGRTQSLVVHRFMDNQNVPDEHTGGLVFAQGALWKEQRQ